MATVTKKLYEGMFLVDTALAASDWNGVIGSIEAVLKRVDAEVVSLRKELLRVVRLHELFNVVDAEKGAQDGLLIVVEGKGKRAALMADEILGQVQAVIKSLGEGIGTVRGISGGAILGDGQVGLILDTAGILELAS